MNTFLSAIMPTVTTAVVALITAAAGWAVAWMRSRTQVQHQAVIGAVAQVDALEQPAQPPRSDGARKAMAVALVEQRLPAAHMASSEKIGAMVDAEVGRQHSSAPPKSGGSSSVLLLAFVALVGCAGLLPFLTTVITAVHIAEDAVTAIQSFADAHAQEQALRDKIDAAATTARAALTVAMQAAKAGGDLARKDVAAAFDDFGKAYQALVDLVTPLGLDVSELPKLSARPGHLTVPSARALRAEMER